MLSPVLSFTQIQTVAVLRDELHQKKTKTASFPQRGVERIKIKAVLGYHRNQLLAYSGSCFSLSRTGLETTG